MNETISAQELKATLEHLAALWCEVTIAFEAAYGEALCDYQQFWTQSNK